MGLIKSFDIVSAGADQKPVVNSLFTTDQLEFFSSCLDNESLDKAFPSIRPCSITHFYTNGQWSHHDLLNHLLSMTGPAHVRIAVWTMSVTAANMLGVLLQKGIIKSLELVLDVRCKTRIPDAFQLASKSFSKVVIKPCHAKLTLINSESHKLVINTSANYTNNPRLEAGVVCTSKTNFDFYNTLFDDILKK